jgi:hypothetical protein
MTIDVSKIIATRDFKALYEDWASGNVFPADSIDYGDLETTANWVEAGGTVGGLSIAFNVQRGSISIDQFTDPVLTPVSGRTITMSTNLAEITVANLDASAALGTTATTAAGSGTKGNNRVTISDAVPDEFRSWIFEALKQDAEPFRVLGYKTQMTGSPTVNIRPTEPAQIALSVGCRVDTSSSPARVLEVREIIPALP